jgi:hypothetical protein
LVENQMAQVAGIFLPAAEQSWQRLWPSSLIAMPTEVGSGWRWLALSDSKDGHATLVNLVDPIFIEEGSGWSRELLAL